MSDEMDGLLKSVKLQRLEAGDNVARIHLRNQSSRHDEQAESASVYVWSGYQGHGDHIFGGVLLAHACAATVDTIRERESNKTKVGSDDLHEKIHIHSLHANFTSAGDARSAVVYLVEEIRAGGSFSLLRVEAWQFGKLLFTANTSVVVGGPITTDGKQRFNNNLFEHVESYPPLPIRSSPDDMPSVIEKVEQLQDKYYPDSGKHMKLGGMPMSEQTLRRVIGVEKWRQEAAYGFPSVDLRMIEPLVSWAWKHDILGAVKSKDREPGQKSSTKLFDDSDRRTKQYCFMRMRPESLSKWSDHNIHKCMLAYLTDIFLIDTALHAYGLMLGNEIVDPLSLDHVIYFHDDEQAESHSQWRADEWILLELEIVSIRNGRALCRGKAFTERGKHIATTMQEGLMKLKPKPKL